jgi:hypothetical protein
VLEVRVAKPEQTKPRRIEIGGSEHKTIEGSATPSSTRDGDSPHLPRAACCAALIV